MGRADQAAFRPGFFRVTGFVSLLVITLLAAFSSLGLEIYLKANAEDRIARREAQSRQAIYAAEGGIEWAKAQLSLNPDWRGGAFILEESPVEVSVALGPSGYLVTSTARSGFAKRDIQLLLSRTSGKWTISNYQELHR